MSVKVKPFFYFFQKKLTGLKNYLKPITIFKSICDKLGLLLRGFTKSLHSKKYIQVNLCENRKNCLLFLSMDIAINDNCKSFNKPQNQT